MVATLWGPGCDLDSERRRSSTRPPSESRRLATGGETARPPPQPESKAEGHSTPSGTGTGSRDRPTTSSADSTTAALTTTSTSSPATSTGEAIDELEIGCDRECVGGELDGDDLRTPVDREHGLRPSWSPDDLLGLKAPYVIEVGSPPNLLRKAAAEAFVELSDAAHEATGVRINIRSGYRPFALQCSIFKSEARNLGCAEATRASARAGFSEHQLGTTADLAIGWRRLDGKESIDTFLDDHAHDYGWVLSYPDGAEAKTGYKYEPWHYRYIGPEAAKELVSRSVDGRRLSTQEYLAEAPKGARPRASAPGANAPGADVSPAPKERTSTVGTPH